MAGVVLAIPRVKFTLPSGEPAALGWVTVYEAGTTTLANTWQDKAQTTLNENPIHLDANGECLLWADSTKTYKILLQDSELATVSGWPVDNIPGAADVGSITAAATDAAAVALTPYVTAAQLAETNAETAETNAELAEANAETAQAAAEVARDAALAATKIYADTTAGLAAVANGEYFYVPSADADESLILYKDNAGVAVEVKRFLSTGIIDQYPPVGVAWAVLDGTGNAALTVLDDGTVQAGRIESDALAIVDSTTDFVDEDNPGFVWAIKDATGNIAIGVRTDGTVEVDTLEAANFGAANEVPLQDRLGGVFSAQLNYICTAGQSLAGGSDAAITTAQEYDNIGFGAFANNPVTTYALTTGNTAVAPGNENPMYGTAGHIKELLVEENGLAYADFDYQLLSCCNGSSGSTIDQLKKGGATGLFEKALTQVTSGYNIATGEGRTFAFQAVTWTQGESNLATPKATYKATMKQLAADFNTDGKAITGQANDVQFISYQICQALGVDTVAPAQLEASEEVPYIHVATPIYFMDFYDGTHLVGASSKWLGGYYGLVYKRVVIDRQEWAPLKPIQHAVIGNCIDLYFNKENLALDTTLMPAQASYGFTAFNGAAVAQTISSVEIIQPNRVRLTCASTPAAGWTVKYGHITVLGKTNYSGPGGNLRDSQGDYIVYDSISKPMHNWCVLFSRTI